MRSPEADIKTVYPPGPFPPHGREAEGSVDLGIRLRDTLYRRDLIVGPAREALASWFETFCYREG